MVYLLFAPALAPLHHIALPRVRSSMREGKRGIEKWTSFGCAKLSYEGHSRNTRGTTKKTYLKGMAT
jgi:hypothetical protein